MTRIGRAAVTVVVGFMVVSVGVAPVTAGKGSGGDHGSASGGSTGGRGYGGGSASSPGSAIASGRAFSGLSHVHHHHHHRFHGDHAYGYYDYDVCAYYYRRAQASGSPFWWRRYEVCTEDD
jgi:hypothetical protein